MKENNDREYSRLKDDLSAQISKNKSLESDLAVLKLSVDDASVESERFKSEIERLNVQINELKELGAAESQRHEQDTEALKKRLRAEAEASRMELAKAFKKASEVCQAQEKELRDMDDKMAKNQAQMTVSNKRVQNATSETEALRTAKTKLEDDVLKKEREKQEIITKYTTAIDKAESRASAAEVEILKLRGEQSALESSLIKSESEVSDLRSSLAEQKDSAKRIHSAMANEKTVLEVKVHELSGKLNDAMTALEATRSEAGRNDSQVKRLSDKVRILEEANARLASTTAESQTLEDRAKRREASLAAQTEAALAEAKSSTGKYKEIEKKYESTKREYTRVLAEKERLEHQMAEQTDTSERTKSIQSAAETIAGALAKEKNELTVKLRAAKQAEERAVSDLTKYQQQRKQENAITEREKSQLSLQVKTLQDELRNQTIAKELAETKLARMKKLLEGDKSKSFTGGVKMDLSGWQQLWQREIDNGPGVGDKTPDKAPAESPQDENNSSQILESSSPSRNSICDAYLKSSPVARRS